jgi:hypothetical protein
MGAVLPLLAVEFQSVGTAWAMYFSMYSVESKNLGMLYTLSCSLVLIVIATLFRPKNRHLAVNYGKLLQGNVRNICFTLGFVGLMIELILNLIYGMSPSNIVQQRPLFGALFSYIAVLLRPGFLVILIDDLIGSKVISRKALYLLGIFLASTALSGSRSGMISLYLIIIFSLAYSASKNSLSPKRDFAYQVSAPRRHRYKFWILISLFAVLSAIIGQLVRHDFDGSTLAGLLVEGFVRLYLNNVALYLAIEDPDKIYRILMENQPRVMISQFFSVFGIPRELPSSFRLLEWWGGTIDITDSGHIAGYAYGWLGLSFGLFGWSGIFFVSIVFVIFFKLLLLSSYRNVTLASRLVFTVTILMFIEFFSNLGLDSYFEKIVKTSVFHFIFYLIVRFLLISLKRPSRSIPVHIL